MRRRGFDSELAGRLLAALARGEGRLEDVLGADAALPCRPILTRWRREEPVFDLALRRALAGQRARRAAAAGCVGREMTASVTRAIRMGETFAGLGRRAGFPSRQTLRQWCARDPAFAAAVARACELRDLWLSEQMREVVGDWRGRTRRELQAIVAPLSRRRARLGHRPGTAHRRRGEETD